VSRLASRAPTNFFAYTAPSSQAYAFSFCNNIAATYCDDGAGGRVGTAAMAMKAAGGCQQSFGLASNTTAKLLPTDLGAGVAVTYSGGPPCPDGSPSSSTFNLQCDPTVATVNVTSLVVVKQNCALEFYAVSAAACPYPKTRVETPLGAGWIAAIVVVASLSLYCAVGAGVKRYRMGTSGIESVPHIDTLRALWAGAARVVLRLRGGGAAGGAAAGDYLAAPGDEEWR
jgi:hypothetical protein